MSGRKENEEKMDKKIKDTLKKCPEYMTRYYYSLNNKSYTTKDKYIHYVLDFLDFLNKAPLLQMGGDYSLIYYV